MSSDDHVSNVTFFILSHRDPKDPSKVVLTVKYFK